MNKPSINSVRILHKVDRNPDLDYLGKYSNSPAEVHIDRQERGHMQQYQYQFFNLGSGDPDYFEQDYMRAEAFNRGAWYSFGIFAEAEIKVPNSDGPVGVCAEYAVTQIISSGGIWGIESDSDPEHLKSSANEELDQLRSILRALGIDASGVPDADHIEPEVRVPE